METAEILHFLLARISIEEKVHPLPLRGLVAVAQVATMGQVQAHQSIMRSHDSLVDLKVGGAATQALDVDTPFLGIAVEGLEGASLAGQFDGINVLVSTVVSGTWVPLGVFVGHG